MNCKYQIKNAHHLALVSLPETLDLSWLGVGSGEMALSRPRRALGWCPIPPRRIDWRSRVEITRGNASH
jgi:hypothetical protein